MRTGNDGSVEINLSVSLLEMRDNQFRRLQRQTSQLLNLAMQDGRLQTESRPTLPVSEDADAEPQGDRPFTENISEQAVSATSPPQAEETSATTAPSEAATGSSGVREGTTVPRPGSQRQPDVTIARLAEMLSEQRRLWREMEPQLDRWETMLRAEQASQEAVTTSESSTQPPEPAADSVATPSFSGEEAMDVEQDFADEVASTATTVTPKEHTDEVAVTSAPEWNQSFFNQISGLLHLHAHMLHLLSDFAVGTPNRSSRTAESATNSTSTATEQPETQTTLTTSPAATEVPSVEVRSTPVENHSATPAQSRPHRVVIAPEYGGQIVHAHINIEPTTVTIAQPISTVSAGSGLNRVPAVSVLTPPSQNILSDTESSGAHPNRRRSQSARPMPAATTTTTTTEHNLPTAFIFEHPAAATSAGADLIPPTVYDDLSRDVLNFIEMVPALVTQRPPQTAVVVPQVQFMTSRVPPRASNLPLSRSVGNLAAESRGEAADSAPVSSAASQPRASQLGSTASRRRPVPPHAPASPRLPFIVPPGLAPGNVPDPFLSCRSRHFAYMSRTAGANRRRGTNGAFVMTPSARPGRAGRRSRSVGVQSPMIDSSSPHRPGDDEESETANSPSDRLDAASDTVHSMAIPLGTSFSIGGQLGLSSLSQQLQNMLTTSLSQPIDLLQQTARTGQSAPSGGSGNHMTAVVGPFTWVLNHNLGAAPVASAPARPSADAEFEELTGETGLTLLPGVLIEGIVRTIWSFISDLAADQLDEASAPSRAHVWTSPSDLVINSASAANSLLSQTFLHLRHNLHAGGYLSSPSPTSDMHMHNCIDGLRRPLRHILPPNYMTERDSVRDRLIDLLLASRLRDLLVLQDSSQNPEAGLVDWASKRARTVNSEPVDIRHSLLAFLTPRVMNQMTLWSQSPTNSGFGSLLALTLNQMALDLFGFADLLSATAAERLGLRLTGRENATSTTSPGGGRSQIFGHTMSYEPLLQHLDAFASTLGADSDDRRVLIIIRAGLVDSLSRYCSLGSHGLNRYVGAPLSFITYRALPGTPVASTNSESDGARPLEVDRTSAMKRSEDSDASDMYEDARDTLVEATPSVPVIVTSQVVPTASVLAASSSVNKRPKLPEWKPTNGEVPGSIAEALSPNPQSPGLVIWNASIAGDGATVDGLPRQWLQLVSHDVATMNAQSTHPSNAAEANASSSPGSLASPPEHGMSKEVTSSEYRLSDAYISGMPAKRRKVMLENKSTLLCPIQNMFSNLLNEAVLATEAPNPGSVQLSAPPVSGVLATAAAADTPQIQPPAPPVNPGEVTDALKSYVSNHLSKRLTTDTDFDPARFPKAAEVFLKPKVEK
ncbi:unnamed protein product [Schistocephalus solidus]|uniref:RING-type domain-containing protein n=1 Tax=Schistocephalus solidus TaxID=70667 RepID=A0A183SLQ8_SCHSO|nr:unnamed protein product [Schistocephalus solidus]